VKLLPVQKPQHRTVERLWVLQECKVAGIRQDQQPGMRDGGGETSGMLAPDRLVMVAIDDPYRLSSTPGPVWSQIAPTALID
jgi:hypothetical protein